VISTLHYGRSAHSPVHEPPLWQPERSQHIKAAECGFLPDTVTWALRVPTEDYPLIYDRTGSGYGRAAAWVSAAVAQVGPSLGGSLCLALRSEHDNRDRSVKRIVQRAPLAFPSRPEVGAPGRMPSGLVSTAQSMTN
jgi:hypothetical protein